MSYVITTATKKIYQLQKRIKAIQGGTSAGKTIGTMQVLIDRCQRDKPGEVTSVISETFPHLQKGAIRDFLGIMQVQNYYNEKRWNKTNSTYTFETGAILEFFSADEPEKVKGPRRKRLFLNECNHLNYDIFDQAEVRTSEEIFIDWNPDREFWFYSEILGKRDDVDHIILTYKDNEGLPQNIIDSIERRKNRADWWRVYGLGLLGEVKGKIYTGWSFVDEIPKEARLVRRGLDFGYTNDPTAILDIYYLNGGYILDESCYQTGLTNKSIAERLLLDENKVLVIADSAEPKSIDEIYSYGANIAAAVKGPGSISFGIQLVQGQRISVTKRSVNLIKEYRNYLWEVDKDGKVLNRPEQGNDHLLDAMRYAFTTLVKPVEIKKEAVRVEPPASRFEGKVALYQEEDELTDDELAKM